MPLNRVLRLRAYATGLPGPEHFTLTEEPIAELEEGQVLVRVLWLGMDPFPRLRIAGPGGRAPPLPLGSVMIGRGVGRVEQSSSPAHPVGTYLAGDMGWQEWAVLDPSDLKPVDPSHGEIRHSLGVLGPSGLAAWCALIEVGRAAAGETVLVSAAAGSVGSVAVQLAKARGCRVIGIGGGPIQLDYLSRDLGLDAVIDYTAEASLSDQLKTAAPQGVQLFLDLVGGAVFDAGLQSLTPKGRAVLVGCIADYNDPAGQPQLAPRPNLPIILKRLTIEGFLVADHANRFGVALAELSEALRGGALKAKERIVQGLEKAPEAFAGLFGAEFVGKQLVRLTDE